MSALIQRFVDNGLSLKGTYIVHVRAMNAPFAEVKAYHTREETKKWSFHAFMIRGSKVFDMDFGKSAQATPVSEYLEKMFFPLSVRKKQKLFFQIKPASLYSLEDFDGTMNLKDYPLRTLEEVQGLQGYF